VNNLFRATLQDVGLIRDSLDSIASLITEGTFKIGNDGIRLTAMDPASVAMVDFKILPSAFLDFSSQEEHIITLNIGNFVEVLRRARANDQVSFELAENKLRITMKGDFKRNFSIPLIDTPPGSQKIPELSFKGRIILSNSALREGIRDAAMVSDCVILEAEPTSFRIRSLGDTSETRMELTKDSMSLNELEVSSQIAAKYSIDYFDKMLKGSKVADTVKLQFSSDYPLRMDCTAVDKLQLSFILAPRVDTD
jgi:proliferating cell nuclear antigen